MNKHVRPAKAVGRMRGAPVFAGLSHSQHAWCLSLSVLLRIMIAVICLIVVLPGYSSG